MPVKRNIGNQHAAVAPLVRRGVLIAWVFNYIYPEQAFQWVLQRRARQPHPRQLSALQSILDMSGPKGTIALNNYLQGIGKLAALSWVDVTAGAQHSPTWTSTCKIDGRVIATGSGPLKHIARDEAADKAFEILRRA
ncbi:unnamed protein product [Peniophora sp. CBMAI 1063]|nr:unnamed protein product [Peniophora sp. CBMAI 1063]